ncbi:hypothetical protein GCM10009576_051990 [Streptomyces rhizosphaericus]|uniref:Orc1-like AAA ATPase domain-containing protein n=1 Tax=Streptomyces rhizosphaericus TaxID=114699 RepID=A0ABN1SDY7_9ACTN|nr:ATP-binding protein [Streptomyces indonesiensis]
MAEYMDHQNRTRRTLLERERELRAVDAALTELCGTDPADGAETRSGGVIAFEGPGGVGKTALLGEARRRAAARGCTVLRARGGEHEQGAAFHVVRQLFQPVLAETGEDESTAGSSAAGTRSSLPRSAWWSRATAARRIRRASATASTGW